MKPPKWNPIQSSDYKDAPSWFGQLAYYLNNILQPIIQVLNNNITFSDNIRSKKFTKNFTTSASYSSGTFDSFSFPLTYEPDLVVISKNTSGSNPAPSGVGLKYSYSQSDKQITISYIYGLENSTEYDITLMVT